MKIKGTLMNEEGMANTFRRLAHQIIERNGGVSDLVIIGIRTRGVTVAQRIKENLEAIEGLDIPLGIFDIALYRDDLASLDNEVEFFGRAFVGCGDEGRVVAHDFEVRDLRRRGCGHGAVRMQR